MTDIHNQINSLIAAYAMGAVPAEEIPAIRAHILTCDECFEEAESYASALAVLAESVDPVPLSKDFTDRVLEQAVGGRTPEASKGRKWLPQLRSISVGAAIVVTIVASILMGNSYLDSREREREYQLVVMALVHDPNALSLGGPGGAEGVIASTDSGAIFVALDLGEAPSGTEYQLWLMKDGVPVPDTTFDVTDAVVIVETDRSIDGYDGAAVTVEPEGGSEQPTTDPVMTT